MDAIENRLRAEIDRLLFVIKTKEITIEYYKERACCDPENKWGHTKDCKLAGKTA